MANFKKNTKGDTPAISTASLPDIVFMLLFFFMVSTTMREVELKVQVTMPEASQVKKLEKKSLISYIYVGPPLSAYQATLGSAPRIQLNNSFASLRDIDAWITSERESRDEADIPMMMTALKVDQDTEMGIVTDIKQELRKSNALKLTYSTRRVFENL